MKRSTMIWLISASALVLIGALMFIGVLSANHWDFAVIGGTAFETTTIEISDPFETISIHSDTSDILFHLSDNGSCKAVFFDHPKVKPIASVQDGTLSVETVDSRKWYEHFMFSFVSPKMTVYLPKEAYAALHIEEKTGDIMIPKELSFEEINISASTGDIICNAASSGRAVIEASTGDIHLENTSAKTLELSVSTGEVSVSSVACVGDLKVSVSTGDVILNDVSCGNLLSDGSTGDAILKDVIAAGSVSIERSTGDVRFEQCDAAELSVTTNTGDITGTLLSEKVFLTQSDTGEINVPESTTGGKCKITTNTGDILIEVPQD